MLNALVAYRRRITTKEYRPTLAVVATGADWREDDACRLYYEGARRRAEELGYQAEVFVASPNKLNPQRLVEIMQTRDIRGVLVLPILDASVNLNLLPGRFRVVAIGYKFTSPAINRVSINHFAAVGDAIQKLTERGYRRPGLVLRAESPKRSPSGVSHVGQLWKGGYLAECAKQIPSLRIPVIQPTDTRQLIRWLKRYKPDVIISQDRKVGHIVARSHPDVLIVYTMVDDDPTLTGINQNSLQVGRRAVDLIAADLYGTEPEQFVVPVTVLVGTGWQEGRRLANGRS